MQGAGGLNVTNSFSQSGGAIVMGGPVGITQNTGDLNVGAISASAISLTARNGRIGQTAALVTTGLLATQSALATFLNHSGNHVASFKAMTSGPGNIELTHVGILDIKSINAAEGNVRVINTGGVSTSGKLVATQGDLAITANSPLTVGAAGIFASGDITLNATNLTSSGNMTLDGDITSGAGGILLMAGNNFVQNSTLTAALGIDALVQGSMSFGPLATSTGNPVRYVLNGQSVAPPRSLTPPVTEPGPEPETIIKANTPTDFVVAFTTQFEEAIAEQEAGSVDPLKPRKKDKEAVIVEGETCTR
jgi:hypothetical protein